MYIRQGGKDATYYVKYLYYRINFLIFNQRQQRFNTFSVHGKNSIDVGILPTDAQRKLELKQDVNKQGIDELHFSGVDVKNGNLLEISVARKEGSKCCSCLYFVLNHNGILRKYRIPTENNEYFEKKGDNFWTAGDLKIWCLEPLHKWRILYIGFLEWRPYSSVMDHLECTPNEVLAKACAKATSLKPQERLMTILNQYDIWGVFYGTYSINSEDEQEIVLRGNKTHHIGDFNWQNVHSYMMIKMYFELCFSQDGSVCSLNAASLTSGIPEIFWGYVELSRSETHKVTSSDFDFPRMQYYKEFPSLFSFRLKTDHDEYILNLRNYQDNTNWSSEKDVDVKMSRIQGSLINITQNLIKEGLGSVHYAVEKDLSTSKTTSSGAMPPVFLEKIADEKVISEDILLFTDPSCTESAVTGGKGSSLAILSSISDKMFIVPSGFCITISAYQKHLQSNPEIVVAIDKIIDICRILEHFLKSSISDDLKSNIIETMNSLFENQKETKRFAVRSSALGEDGEEISSAGQMETILGCKGIHQVCEAVKSCWASLYSFKAVEYRRQNGQQINEGICVVIQEMVPAKTAGVMFTRDPMTGSPKHIEISANYGLGMSVVSSTCDPDAITVIRNHKDVLVLGKIVPGKKKTEVVMTETGVTEKSQVSQNPTICCLTDNQIMKLAQIGLYIEKRYGNAMDIEWAIVNENIYVLQSRPITSIDQMTEFEYINEFNTALKTDYESMSSSNVKEVMPGAVSPIWNSYFEDMFEIAVKRAGYLMFYPVKNNIPYLRLTTQCKWHRFMNRTEMNYKFNEKNTSVESAHSKNGFDIAINGRIIKDDLTDQVGTERYGYMSRYIRSRNKWAIMKVFSTRKKLANAMMRRWTNFDLTFEKYDSATELSQALFTETEPLLEHSSITSSQYIVYFFHAATTLEVTENHYSDFANLMAIESSTDDVESVNIPKALKELSLIIDKEIGKRKFTSMSVQEAVSWLQSNENPVKKNFDEFIQRHGHRCFKELDVISKTWSMQPSQLIAPLMATLDNLGFKEVKKLGVDEVLSSLKTDFTSEQKMKLRGTVIEARKYVALREQAKVRKGYAPDGELLMFMSHVEILTLAQKRSPTIIIRAMNRRKLMSKLEKQKFPELSHGYPVPITKPVLYADESTVIQGTPVSRGVIEATARVVLSIEEADSIQPGDILIASSTDIAWSPYFPSLSGVITELGGLISHGAVVAREYGIPCVVGVPHATDQFKSGDFIRLNGNNGKIERLKV
ncbi:Prodigiosin synthesizing transferase PigC [Nymphon striatum]|nr:Prodigiosin synthesizing transferase PigC [Nymphon striatum]